MKDNHVPLLSLDEIFSIIGFGKFHWIIIIIFGLIQCFDAIELILLAFLGPILRCVWRINLLESSIITMSVFVGMIFGALGFGKFSDFYGRKKTVIVSMCGIFYFSLICAGSPTVIWIVILRSVIGVFIGGVMIVISTFLTEIMPIQHRGISQMCVQVFWSLGSYFISFTTLLVVPRLGWRLWLLISASPMILIFPALLWIPESPRYLLLANRKAEVIKIINDIALMNGAEPISDVQRIEYKKPSLSDIFHSNYLLTTFISTFICFISGITYYAFVLSASIINDIPHKCLQDPKMIFNPARYSNTSLDNSCCFLLTWDSMETVFISVSGELISYLLAIILICFMKRKFYLQILMLINAVVFILMNLCLSPFYMGIVMMFGRGSAITMLGIQYLYISEVFPTTIRSLSIGLGGCFARIGAISSSLIVNMLMVNKSFLGSTLLYFSLNIMGFLLVFALPYETKDRALLQSVDENILEHETIKSDN